MSNHLRRLTIRAACSSCRGRLPVNPQKDRYNYLSREHGDATLLALPIFAKPAALDSSCIIIVKNVDVEETNSVLRIIHSLRCLFSNYANCISQSVLCRVCCFRLLTLSFSLFLLQPIAYTSTKVSLHFTLFITWAASYGCWSLNLASRTSRYRRSYSKVFVNADFAVKTAASNALRERPGSTAK